MKTIFEKVPPGEGDEFAAVKPWLGAIKEPKSHPKPNKKAPVEKFGIDWIYGYRNEEVRMNCQFNTEGNAVYATAAVGVVFDYKNMKQSYFGGGKTDFGGRKQDDESKNGHSDDVTALAMSFSRKMIASGQNGQKPIIFLWDALTAKVMKEKRLPKGSRLVTAIGISATDKYICACDAAEKITCHIFDIDGGKAAIATVGINMKVVHLAWSPVNEQLFGTAGKDHIAMCTLNSDMTVKMTKGKAKGGKIESQCCAAWLNDAKYPNDCITGATDGKLYHWSGDSAIKDYDCCTGAVTSVACRVDASAGGEIVIAGGKDKSLTIFKFAGSLTKLWSIKCDAAPLSVDLFNGQLLLGLKNGSIVEMPYTADGKGAPPNVIMTSHCDGEVWGLDMIDIDGAGDIRILTSADDNRILAYKPKEHMALAEGKVADPPKKKPKGGYKGGASSMSSQPAEC
jgi:WD40 repeat protein